MEMNIRKYLKDIAEVENQIYAYQEMERRYEDWKDRFVYVPKVDVLSQCITLSDYKYKKYREGALAASYKKVVNEYSKPIKKMIRKRFFLWLILAAAGVGLCAILFQNSNDPMTAIVVAFLVGLGLFCAFFCIFAGEELSWLDKTRTKKIQEYYAECEIAEINEENRKKEPVLTKVTEQYTTYVMQPLEKLKKIREELYGFDVVHQKYRNVTAISQIFEYIDTERCVDFAGPGGAYNVYELELKQYQIRYGNSNVQEEHLIRWFVENNPNGYLAEKRRETEHMINEYGSYLWAIKYASDLDKCSSNHSVICTMEAYKAKCLNENE